MWQLKRRDGVLVLYQSGILGSALSALLWGSRNHAVGPLSLATLDLKAYLMKCPPRLIIAETDFPPALAGMIAGKLPQVPLYSVSPDRPVVMGRCDRLEWPLTS
ncbi:MAG: hypothetical protein HYX99_00985, partial [Chloroflexi bacterium]|nr:hypothetical protein [Chloroflexota bacterium]